MESKTFVRGADFQSAICSRFPGFASKLCRKCLGPHRIKGGKAAPSDGRHLVKFLTVNCQIAPLSCRDHVTEMLSPRLPQIEARSNPRAEFVLRTIRVCYNRQASGCHINWPITWPTSTLPAKKF